METARMSAPPSMMAGQWTGPASSSRTSAAVESTVDAYATRVLKDMSPPEACIDESLGPYVTSLLRCYSDADGDVTSIPEFDSLLELLEEHCSLTPESATTALTTISTAVRTGIVPEPVKQKSGLMTSVDTAAYGVNPDSLFSVATDDRLAADEFPTLSEATNGESGKDEKGTPIKPDNLIPVDLLEDPLSPVAQESADNKEEEEGAKVEDAFSPPGESAPASSKKNSVPKSKKASKKEADDLAAVLFRSSRTRQSSSDSDTLSKPASATKQSAEAQPYYPTMNNQYFQQQWDAAVEMLLSMNPELSEEAAAEAALVANTDVNLAQYIVQEAFQAPPICRHMLNDVCYRSDCQFSHDVEGHTCLFWLRGRCGKGHTCRFLHGFSEKVLEGIQSELAAAERATAVSSGARSQPVAIATTNLVSHNMQAAFSAPQHDTSPFSSFVSTSSGFESSSYTLPSHMQAENFLSSSLGKPSTLETAMKSFHRSENRGQDQVSGDGGFSFATIASKCASQGYKDTSSAQGDSSARDSSAQSTNAAPRTVKIPQDLWNAHIHRDASAFHIPDPMERYVHVAASVSREDVIDLHYQSTKTFPVVLFNVLPEKLRDHGECWIVTGTGHHVGSKTHQKSGGALESAVMTWLSSEGYDFIRGRDRNGHGGAVLVKST